VLEKMYVSRAACAISDIVKHSNNKQFQDHCNTLLSAKNNEDLEEKAANFLQALFQSKGKRMVQVESFATTESMLCDDKFVFEDLEDEEF